jgi:uncharacterized protein YaaR (DUF327 family)
MAKVDFPPDPTGAFLNPATYANPNTHPRSGRAGRGKKVKFSSVLEQSQAQAQEIREALPVSEETLNQLLSDVRSSGDALRDRPFPQEILTYKKAVRDFMRYVVDNGYQVGKSLGVPSSERPNYKGTRGTQERVHVAIQVVDHKLEELAAMLLTHQHSQLELLSRLEEIRGILVDLVS